MATVTTLPRKKSWQTKAELRSVEAEMAITRERVMAQMVRLREMNPRPDGSPMSQEEAAHKAEISARTWQRWEAGDTVPYPKNLGAVAEKFGVSVAFFETETTPAVAPLTGDERLDELAHQLHRIESNMHTLFNAVNLLLGHFEMRAEAEALQQELSEAPEQDADAGRRQAAA